MEKTGKILEHSEATHNNTEDNNEYQAKLMKVLDSEVRARKIMKEIEQYLIKCSNKAKFISTTPSENRRSSGNVNKITQIWEQAVNGDPTIWKSLTDTFGATIDKVKDICDVGKLTYSVSCLNGEDEQCMQSLRTTNEKYAVEIDLLYDRFENPQIIINTPMSIFLLLQKFNAVRDVKSSGVYSTVHRSR